MATLLDTSDLAETALSNLKGAFTNENAMPSITADREELGDENPTDKITGAVDLAAINARPTLWAQSKPQANDIHRRPSLSESLPSLSPNGTTYSSSTPHEPASPPQRLNLDSRVYDRWSSQPVDIYPADPEDFLETLPDLKNFPGRLTLSKHAQMFEAKYYMVYTRKIGLEYRRLLQVVTMTAMATPRGPYISFASCRDSSLRTVRR